MYNRRMKDLQSVCDFFCFIASHDFDVYSLSNVLHGFLEHRVSKSFSLIVFLPSSGILCSFGYTRTVPSNSLGRTSPPCEPS